MKLLDLYFQRIFNDMGKWSGYVGEIVYVIFLSFFLNVENTGILWMDGWMAVKTDKY